MTEVSKRIPRIERIVSELAPIARETPLSLSIFFVVGDLNR